MFVFRNEIIEEKDDDLRYSAWIKEFDGEQVELLSERLGLAHSMPLKTKLSNINQ